MTRKANDITTDITAATFAVHYGEGMQGRFRGFNSHRAAARFANSYIRGNSAEAFARVYEIARRGGRVFLVDNGEVVREIPGDLIQ